MDDLQIARHAFILCCGKCGHQSKVDVRRGTSACHSCGSPFKHYRQVSKQEADALSKGRLKDAEISLGSFQGRGIVTSHVGEIPEELKRAFSESIRRARVEDPERMRLRDYCSKTGRTYSVQSGSLARAVRRVRTVVGE